MTNSLRLWGVPELVGSTRVVFVPERRFQLLSWLAVNSGQWLSRDQAATLLWPEHASVQARRNLRKVLVEARSVPGVGGLDVNEHALRWTVRTDLADFDAGLRDDPRARASVLALRRGALLEGMEAPSNRDWTDWLDAERARLQARWQRVAHEHLAALQDPAQRGEWAQRLLALDPLDDAATTAWIEACMARGAVAAARQAWEAYAEQLARELGIEPPSQMRALLSGATGAAAVGAGHRLSADAFVGRSSEIAELKRLIGGAAVRVVTLLGPGGIGKSRLANQALPQLAALFDRTAITVAMHDLDDVASLAARLAQRLGAPLSDGRDTAVQVGAMLNPGKGSAQYLLLLDNAEHLNDLPAWLARVLATASDLKVLVTSRTRLQLPGEQMLALHGLALPDESSLDIDAAPAFDAVRLFVARAEVALPGFDLARHLPAVLSIVQQCAGWPLAIEMAAAWVRLLPPDEIARDLRQSLDVLERDPTAAGPLARPDHASVRRVFERSLVLLAPREREALEALSVFRGSFARAAAQAVAGTALPLLASLVDKSLLATTDQGRFVLHPLLAALAAERLAARPGQLAQLRDRHARYLLRRLIDAGGPGGADTRDIDALVDTEEADLRQAWQHALAQRAADLVAPVLTVWAGFFDRRGRQREGAAMLRPALQWPAADAASDRVLGRARAAVAVLWFMAREPRERVRELADSGIAPARRAGDGIALARCLAACAACDSELGRLDAARAGFEESLALTEAHGDAAAAVRCLRNLGSVAMLAGDYAGALDSMRRAQQRAREAGLDYAEVDALLAQSGPHVESADWAAAERVLRQALPMAAVLGARQLLLNGRCVLGCALIELGRFDEARTELERVREDATALGQDRAILYADTYQALRCAREGALDAAEAALRDVAVRARDRGWTNESMRALLFHGEVLARRGDRLGAAAVWRVVDAEKSIPAGDRDSARRWAAELDLSDDERTSLDAVAPDSDGALAALCRIPGTGSGQR